VYKLMFYIQTKLLLEQNTRW